MLSSMHKSSKDWGTQMGSGIYREFCALIPLKYLPEEEDKSEWWRNFAVVGESFVKYHWFFSSSGGFSVWVKGLWGGEHFSTSWIFVSECSAAPLDALLIRFCEQCSGSLWWHQLSSVSVSRDIFPPLLAFLEHLGTRSFTTCKSSCVFIL